tara:strand:+ start:937 stop:1149 length:213 start_codon:yes stop_codon:yes gene_type:complete
METELQKIARIMGASKPQKSGTIMPFGKFAGRDLSEIKSSYLTWMTKQDVSEKLLHAIEDELGRKDRNEN